MGDLGGPVDAGVLAARQKILDEQAYWDKKTAESLAEEARKPKAASGPLGGCKNGCGRAPFQGHTTCCTHCRGKDGPHAKDCTHKWADADDKARATATAGYGAAAAAAPVAVGTACCESGCGRPPFGKFKTCCTHCKGPDGPHARDCGSK
eukprot:TRINITY_DN5778_c0_g1_i1.p1 TRINITY_DN5778_c0_g1~~TRINITY_DN5778_c0_g1_i1.p1  ORF type:complete len:150 (+),score=35.32 TRINITY_DN5778_c0_g1_i1:131-580(+)